MLEHYEYQDVHYWSTARTYFGRQIYTTGFYLVDRTLIDCGPPNAISLLTKLFRDIQPKNVLITHHHEDHTGNVHYLQETFKLQAEGHNLTTVRLNEVTRDIPIYRQIVWGRPKPARIAEVANHIQTGTRTLEVIATPGHSDDHICFFDPERRAIFTGDLYLSTYLRYLRADEDIYQIIASLRRVLDLKPRILFCNHRGPVERAEEAIAKKLAFLEQLRDEVLTAAEKGMPIQKIAEEKFKKDVVFRYFSGGELSTINLLRSFLKESDTSNLRV